MITGLPQDGGKKRLHSQRTQTKFGIHQDPRDRDNDPKETESDPRAGVGRSPGEGMGWQRLTPGTRALVVAVLKGVPWFKSSWRSPLTLL